MHGFQWFTLLYFKIVINNLTIEHLTEFQYLGYNVTYKADRNMYNKIITFNQVNGIVIKTLKKSQARTNDEI